MLKIIAPNANLSPWVDALKKLDSSIPISIGSNIDTETEMVLCWKAPRGSFNHYPNLKCICSMGAGVDHIFNDPDIPSNVAVVRLLDSNLNQSMFDYVNHCVDSYILRKTHFIAAQHRSLWQPVAPRNKKDVSIGILGLGAIGGFLAKQFSEQGYPVLGWSRSIKNLAYVDSYTGSSGLNEMVQKSQILICILPLTTATSGLLNLDLLQRLPKGSCLINVARGEHLNESDLITAMNTGNISEAYLDVFVHEPLPEQHPFWKHPKIQLTPHVASMTKPESVAPQIVKLYQNLISGKPLQNVVSSELGY